MNLDHVGISLEQDARGLYSRSTIIYNYIYINIIFVTGFAKTVPNGTRIEIQIIA